MSPICTGDDTRLMSSSLERLFHYAEMEGRGEEKGCKIQDFCCPCLFKQGSLEGFSPLSLNIHFIVQNKGTFFPPFFLWQ